MPDPSSSEPLYDGAAVYEAFVDEMAEIDVAWATGRLDEWLQEKTNRERVNAGIDPTGDSPDASS